MSDQEITTLACNHPDIYTRAWRRGKTEKRNQNMMTAKPRHAQVFGRSGRVIR